MLGVNMYLKGFTTQLRHWKGGKGEETAFSLPYVKVSQLEKGLRLLKEFKNNFAKNYNIWKKTGVVIKGLSETNVNFITFTSVSQFGANFEI